MKKDFFNNKIIQDAVIRRLEIIGEAAKNIPKSVKQINKEIPWKKHGRFQRFYNSFLFCCEHISV